MACSLFLFFLFAVFRSNLKCKHGKPFTEFFILLLMLLSSSSRDHLLIKRQVRES